MAFLIDNNLAPKIAEILSEYFANTCHVADLNMDTCDDDVIWQHAKSEAFTILTKDNDFEAKSRLYGCPPKVVQLKCGNRKTGEILSILRKNIKHLEEFLSDENDCLLFIE